MIAHTHLFNDGDLAEVAGRAALDEGDVGRQTHPVHVVTGSWGKQTDIDGFRVHIIQWLCQKILCCEKSRISPKYNARFLAFLCAILIC